MYHRYKMEIMFDDIFKQAIPFIIFSYDKYRKSLLEKIRQLYGAFDTNNVNNFNTLFNQILDMINKDKRETFDSNRERLIEIFINRNRTYDERLLDHDDRLMKLTKEVSLLRRKKKGKRQSHPIKKKAQKGRKPVSKRKCPHCENNLTKRGKTEEGFQKYYCKRQNNGCGKTFAVDESNNFIKCNECGSVLPGCGKTRICIKCGAKETIE